MPPFLTLPQSGLQLVSSIPVATLGSIDLNPLNTSGYSVVEIHWMGRATGAVDKALLRFTLNSDTTAGAYKNVHDATTSTAGAGNTTLSGALAAATAGVAGYMPGSLTNANRIAHGVITLRLDQPTDVHKIVGAVAYSGDSDGVDLVAFQTVCEWALEPEEDIESIQLFPSSGNFDTGSVVEIFAR